MAPHARVRDNTNHKLTLFFLSSCSKSTYKAMVTGGYNSSQQQAASSTGSSGQQGGNKNKKSKTDVWGPIYQNRQHFVDMHIC